jgi:hypothetical protein
MFGTELCIRVCKPHFGSFTLVAAKCRRVMRLSYTTVACKSLSDKGTGGAVIRSNGLDGRTRNPHDLVAPASFD